MALQHISISATQDETAKTIYTPGRAGTLRADMLGGARRFGALAVRVDTLKDMFAEVAAGNTVIVFQNLALDVYPIWHYALVKGYDLKRAVVILNSFTDENKETDLSTFERTWARGDHWAIVITPPERLPVTATHDAAMRAAVGLERAGRTQDALHAYQSVRDKWPDSYPAAMGVGNMEFTLKHFKRAKRAFETATRLSPQAPQAWNNLAYTQDALGNKTAAMNAVHRAIQLAASGDKALYQDSLKDLRGE